MDVDFDERINTVRLTGDFFLHPEEALYDIEKTLAGLGTNEDEQVIKERLDSLVKQKNIEMIGFTSEDVSKLLKKILSEDQDE